MWMTDWQRADRPRRRIGPGVEVHATIGSTNDRARALLEDDGVQGRVVVAEEQSAGRGRRDRTWLSPPGRNLMMSVAVRPRLAAIDAWRLALAAALAARSGCTAIAPVMLKWPNDLVAADGAKVGGLLIETTIEADRVRSAVIGIGINVNWRRTEMPPEIAGDATSLCELAGREVDRVDLLAAVLDGLDAELVALEAGRSPLARYREACATLGTGVAVEIPSGRVEGRAVEVDDHGALVVETAAGRVSVASGEVARLRVGTPAP